MEEHGKDFERLVWPHLRAAYNVARWLVRNDHDAEDIVQDSFAKAFQAREAFRGGDAKSWLLTIVRNTAIRFLQQKKRASEIAWSENATEPRDHAPDPENNLIGRSQRDRVLAAIERLPDEYRETLVLREIEELPYRDIAGILKVPLGTVMSRLSRARSLLIQELIPEVERTI